MAKYDYHCRECFQWIEVERSIHDVEEPVNCPQCGQPMKRVYGPFGSVFKGQGFYRTDKNKQATNFFPENGDAL